MIFFNLYLHIIDLLNNANEELKKDIKQKEAIVEMKKEKKALEKENTELSKQNKEIQEKQNLYKKSGIKCEKSDRINTESGLIDE